MKNINSIIIIFIMIFTSCINSELSQNDKIKEAEKHQFLGSEFYEKEKYEEAIKNYDKAIELSPKFTAAFLNRGNAKDRINDNQGAIEDYSKVIEIRPDWSTAYFNRALIKVNKLHDSIGAIADYKMAIELKNKLH